MRNVLVQEFESETKFKINELEQIEKRMKDVELIWKRLQKSWSGRKYIANALISWPIRRQITQRVLRIQSSS